MLIGIAGAPNKGKSTLFSAITLTNAEIAAYPFTTIKPNRGVGYVYKKCVDADLGVRCNPRNAACVNGMRFIPIKLIDVAGLVPEASKGKGMGNQFLSDLMTADAIILVIDASGKTDTSGNPCNGCDPTDDVSAVIKEISDWLSSIIKKNMPSIKKTRDETDALAGVLSGLNIDRDSIISSAGRMQLQLGNIKWSDTAIDAFASELIKTSKPIVVAANKIDAASKDTLDMIKNQLEDFLVIPCSAVIELAIKRAEKEGILKYDIAENRIVRLKDVDIDRKAALEFIEGFLKSHDTGVSRLLNETVFKGMDMIAVYPVHDENKYTDGEGNILPDVMLFRRGSTALDMATAIHKDLAKGMLHAIDARKKRRVSKDYLLNDGDVIKIVSASAQ
jgi:hypothetical protein